MRTPKEDLSLWIYIHITHTYLYMIFYFSIDWFGILRLWATLIQYIYLFIYLPQLQSNWINQNVSVFMPLYTKIYTLILLFCFLCFFSLSLYLVFTLTFFFNWHSQPFWHWAVYCIVYIAKSRRKQKLRSVLHVKYDWPTRKMNKNISKKERSNNWFDVCSSIRSSVLVKRSTIQHECICLFVCTRECNWFSLLFEDSQTEMHALPEE